MTSRLALSVTVVALALLPPRQATAQDSATWTVELEGGPVWQSYNDVEIPNDGTATRFSLRDLAGAGPWAAGRLYVTWRPSDRHALRALAAPLTVTGTGTPSSSLNFAGATFQAGVPADATYTFDSYRLTYRYRWHQGDRATAWVGFTAKIRDAATVLEQGSTAGRKTNVGLVPLLHLAGRWSMAPSWSLSLDVDALAGGPGRAEDVALEHRRDLGERWSVEAGYRMVEGGADVDEVYAFAWLHYAAFSVLWRP